VLPDVISVRFDNCKGDTIDKLSMSLHRHAQPRSATKKSQSSWRLTLPTWSALEWAAIAPPPAAEFLLFFTSRHESAYLIGHRVHGLVHWLFPVHPQAWIREYGLELSTWSAYITYRGSGHSAKAWVASTKGNVLSLSF
jgi:hypothetical protein